MKIFLISFLLNLFWELGQMGLYEPMAIYPWCCIKATFWDAVMITATLVLVRYTCQSAFSLNIVKFKIHSKKLQMALEIFLIISVTLFLAIYIERRAILEGRWIYSNTMPLVFGLGLSPLIQLPFTSLLSLYICDKIKS